MVTCPSCPGQAVPRAPQACAEAQHAEAWRERGRSVLEHTQGKHEEVMHRRRRCRDHDARGGLGEWCVVLYPFGTLRPQNLAACLVLSQREWPCCALAAAPTPVLCAAWRVDRHVRRSWVCARPPRPPRRAVSAPLAWGNPTQPQPNPQGTPGAWAFSLNP